MTLSAAKARHIQLRKWSSKCPALSRKMQFCSNSALGVQMLHHARNKYPWFEMQTLYPFDKTGVRTAVADAMAMRTVKSTIVPFPHLLEA